jgi:uncharacterized protein (TIGR03437 family)
MNVPAWTVAIDPNSPVTVYATARTQGVFRSSDGGHTWESINNGITNLSMGRSASVIIDPTNRNTLYVGSEGGGVFKSLDGGDHWFAVNSGLADLTVVGLAMDPALPAVLYVSGPSGVFKTVTGGERQAGSIVISAVVNGASYQFGVIRPGEIVLITGAGLGPAPLIAGTPANGLYNTQLSGTSVQFNGIPAPLIYTSSTQIAALVPGPQSSVVDVTVTYEGRTSAPYRIPATSFFAPGVFTLDATGKGQAVALNQDRSINTASNPAKAGELISLYLTGLLESDPVFVIIGTDSISAATKNLITGVLQVDARLPAGVQTGSAVPVLVLWGDPDNTNNASQSGVTIAVR